MPVSANRFKVQYRLPGNNEKEQHLTIDQPSLKGVLQILRSNFGVEIETTAQLIIHEILPDGRVKVCVEHESLIAEKPALVSPKPHARWSSKYNKFVTDEEQAKLDQAEVDAAYEQFDDYYYGSWDEWCDSRTGKTQKGPTTYYSEEEDLIDTVTKLVEESKETQWKRHVAIRERYSVKTYQPKSA